MHSHRGLITRSLCHTVGEKGINRTYLNGVLITGFKFIICFLKDGHVRCFHSVALNVMWPQSPAPCVICSFRSIPSKRFFFILKKKSFRKQSQLTFITRILWPHHTEPNPDLSLCDCVAKLDFHPSVQPPLPLSAVLKKSYLHLHLSLTVRGGKPRRWGNQVLYLSVS